MDLKELLEHFNNGDTIGEDWAVIEQMRFHSREARKITLEINTKYHEPDELAALFSELIGEPVGENFGLSPPFYTDFGKNTVVGERTFINAGCKFQDQGGIVIGDDCLIGHNATLCTINHAQDPDRRGDMEFHPIHIGNKVWLGANVTILPGVTIGDNSVIGAGSVVTRDIPPDVLALGVPCRVVRPVKSGDRI